MVKVAADRFGTIDILVNNAAIYRNLIPKPFIEVTTEEWSRVMEVNTTGPFHCTKAVFPYMKKKGGKIINISSIRSFQGRAGDLAYAPSKGAVNQLTRSLAIEWGAKGINVNAIAPVFIYTTLNKAILDDPVKRESVLSRIPMKRLGEREDLFGPVLFLASEASNLVNGEILCVDGGWMAA